VNSILQMASAGAAKRILFPFYPAQIRGQEKAVTVAAKSGQFTADETGRASSSEETEGIWQRL